MSKKVIREVDEKYINHVYFYGDVTVESVQELKEKIDLLNEYNEDESYTNPIYLHIHSYGGQLTAGISAMNLIRKSKVPIIAVIDGISASAATFMCIIANYRVIGPFGHILIHELSNGIWGKYSDIEDKYKHATKDMSIIKKIYKKYTKLPNDMLTKLLKRDLFLDAKVCLKYDLVDKILPIKNDIKLPKHLLNIKCNKIIIYQNDIDESTSLNIVDKIYSINHKYKETRISDDGLALNVFISPRPICIYINAEFFHSWREVIPIIDAMSQSKIPIFATVDGICSNAAVLILIAANKKYMHSNSVIKFDKVERDMGINIKDIFVNLKQLKHTVCNLFKAFTKVNSNFLKKIFIENILIDANGAKKIGLIDEIIN